MARISKFKYGGKDKNTSKTARPYLPKDMIDGMYVHSNYTTFYETVKKHQLIGELEKFEANLGSAQNKIKENLKFWLRDLESAEIRFINNYNNAHYNINYTKDELLKHLDNNFHRETTVSIGWEKMKLSLEAFGSDTKLREQTGSKETFLEELKALRKYKKELVNIGKKIDSFVLAYKDYEKRGLTKEGDGYEQALNKLGKISKKLTPDELTNMRREGVGTKNRTRKIYNKVLSEVLEEANRLAGAPYELIVADKVVPLPDKKQDAKIYPGPKLSGDEFYKGKVKTVVDFIFELKNSEDQIGVNVKSHKTSYSITRGTKGSGGLVNEALRGDFTIAKARDLLNYLRKNARALQAFNSDYAHEGYTIRDKVFNKISQLEKRIFFLDKLISALDGVRKIGTQNENIFSLLILFRGGFVWTSSVVEVIIERLDSFLENLDNKVFDGLLTVSYSYNRLNKSETKLKQLYSAKRKTLRTESPEALSSNDKIYNVLFDKNKQLFKGIKSGSLIASVTYNINLKIAREKYNS